MVACEELPTKHETSNSSTESVHNVRKSNTYMNFEQTLNTHCLLTLHKVEKIRNYCIRCIRLCKKYALYCINNSTEDVY